MPGSPALTKKLFTEQYREPDLPTLLSTTLGVIRTSLKTLSIPPDVLSAPVDPRIAIDELKIEGIAVDFIYPLFKPVKVPTVLFLPGTSDFCVGSKPAYRGLGAQIAWTSVCNVYLPSYERTPPPTATFPAVNEDQDRNAIADGDENAICEEVQRNGSAENGSNGSNRHTANIGSNRHTGNIVRNTALTGSNNRDTALNKRSTSRKDVSNAKNSNSKNSKGRGTETHGDTGNVNGTVNTGPEFPVTLDEMELIYDKIRPDYIIGDSLGGSLALSLLLRLRDRNKKIRKQLNAEKRVREQLGGPVGQPLTEGDGQFVGSSQAEESKFAPNTITSKSQNLLKKPKLLPNLKGLVLLSPWADLSDTELPSWDVNATVDYLNPSIVRQAALKYANPVVRHYLETDQPDDDFFSDGSTSSSEIFPVHDKRPKRPKNMARSNVAPSTAGKSVTSGAKSVTSGTGKSGTSIGKRNESSGSSSSSAKKQRQSKDTQSNGSSKKRKSRDPEKDSSISSSGKEDEGFIEVDWKQTDAFLKQCQEKALSHPYVSPFYADFDDFLPVDKIHVIYGRREVLRDQIRRLVNKMSREMSSATITFHEASDMFHSFLLFSSMLDPPRCYPQCVEAANYIEGFINPDSNVCPLYYHARCDWSISHEVGGYCERCLESIGTIEKITGTGLSPCDNPFGCASSDLCNNCKKSHVCDPWVHILRDLCVVGRCLPKDLLVISETDDKLYYIRNAESASDITQQTASSKIWSWFSSPDEREVERKFAELLAYLNVVYEKARDKLDRPSKDIEEEYPFGSLENFSIEFLGVQHLARFLRKIEVLAFTTYAKTPTMRQGLMSLHKRGIEFLTARKTEANLKRYCGAQSVVQLTGGEAPQAFAITADEKQLGRASARGSAIPTISSRGTSLQNDDHGMNRSRATSWARRGTEQDSNPDQYNDDAPMSPRQGPHVDPAKLNQRLVSNPRFDPIVYPTLSIGDPFPRGETWQSLQRGETSQPAYGYSGAYGGATASTAHGGNVYGGNVSHNGTANPNNNPPYHDGTHNAAYSNGNAYGYACYNNPDGYNNVYDDYDPQERLSGKLTDKKFDSATASSAKGLPKSRSSPSRNVRTSPDGNRSGKKSPNLCPKNEETRSSPNNNQSSPVARGSDKSDTTCFMVDSGGITKDSHSRTFGGGFSSSGLTTGGLAQQVFSSSGLTTMLGQGGLLDVLEEEQSDIQRTENATTDHQMSEKGSLRVDFVSQYKNTSNSQSATHSHTSEPMDERLNTEINCITVDAMLNQPSPHKVDVYGSENLSVEGNGKGHESGGAMPSHSSSEPVGKYNESNDHHGNMMFQKSKVQQQLSPVNSEVSQFVADSSGIVSKDSHSTSFGSLTASGFAQSLGEFGRSLGRDIPGYDATGPNIETIPEVDEEDVSVSRGTLNESVIRETSPTQGAHSIPRTSNQTRNQEFIPRISNQESIQKEASVEAPTESKKTAMQSSEKTAKESHTPAESTPRSTKETPKKSPPQRTSVPGSPGLIPKKSPFASPKLSKNSQSSQKGSPKRSSQHGSPKQSSQKGSPKQSSLKGSLKGDGSPSLKHDASPAGSIKVDVNVDDSPSVGDEGTGLGSQALRNQVSLVSSSTNSSLQPISFPGAGTSLGGSSPKRSSVTSKPPSSSGPNSRPSSRSPSKPSTALSAQQGSPVMGCQGLTNSQGSGSRLGSPKLSVDVSVNVTSPKLNVNVKDSKKGFTLKNSSPTSESPKGSPTKGSASPQNSSPKGSPSKGTSPQNMSPKGSSPKILTRKLSTGSKASVTSGRHGEGNVSNVGSVTAMSNVSNKSEHLTFQNPVEKIDTSKDVGNMSPKRSTPVEIFQMDSLADRSEERARATTSKNAKASGKTSVEASVKSSGSSIITSSQAARQFGGESALHTKFGYSSTSNGHHAGFGTVGYRGTKRSALTEVHQMSNDEFSDPSSKPSSDIGSKRSSQRSESPITGRRGRALGATGRVVSRTQGRGAGRNIAPKTGNSYKGETKDSGIEVNKSATETSNPQGDGNSMLQKGVEGRNAALKNTNLSKSRSKGSSKNSVDSKGSMDDLYEKDWGNLG